MALMSKVGAVFYNIGLIISMVIVFLTLKNYDLDNPEATLPYSLGLESFIVFAVSVLLLTALIFLILVSFSKARKKGFIYWSVFIFYLFLLAGIAVFTFGNSIFSDPLNTPGYVYLIIPVVTVMSFFAMTALILIQLPGSIEREKLIMAIKKELKKEIEDTLPFCPECKFRVKPEWKHCPSCGSKFSD